MNKTTLFAICMALCAAPLMAYENDGPDRDTSGKRLMLRSSAALFPAPAASDVLIVVNSGGDIGREKWSGDVIKIPFTIDRYYGDIDKLILSKALPEKVKLTMYVYDVDDKSTSNPPEIDYVHIVNEKGDFTIGKPLYGENGKWTMVTLEFDTQCLNFPAEVGHKAQNELQVVVGEGGWVTAVNWFSIDLPAAPPILFCHGIGTSNCLKTFQHLSKLIDELGIPYDFVQFKNNGNNSINEYSELTWAVENACKNYHVDKVNLVCHSMGGLRARAYTEGADDVFKVLQIATPNGGSPVADFMIEWKRNVVSRFAKKQAKGDMSPNTVTRAVLAFQNVLKKQAKKFELDLDPMVDPAIVSLQTSQMSAYNQAPQHRLNANVEYGVVAGQITDFKPFDDHSNNMFTRWWGISDKVDEVAETLKKLLDDTCLQITADTISYFNKEATSAAKKALDDADGVVTVQSAHTIVPALPDSPLEGSLGEVSHSGLLNDGVNRTFAALRDKLVEKRIDPRTHAVASFGGGSPTRSARAMSVARASAVTETMSNGYNEFGVLFNSSTETCPFDIVSGNNAVVCLSSLGDATVSATLRSPSGVAYTQTAGNVAFSNDGTNVLCVLKNPEKGRWSVEFSAHMASSSAPVPWALVSYENESGIFFEPVLAADTVARGDSFSLRVSPRIGSAAASGSVDVYVTNPDGSQSVVSASESSDGGYVAEIPAPLVGNYVFSVTIDAISPQAFTRTAHLQGTVYAPGSSLSGTGSLVARDENANGMYDKLVFLGEATVSTAGTYRVFANLADAGGNPITEGLSTNVYCEAGTRTFEVPFDGAAIYRHGSCAGYVVSRVQLIEMGPNYEAVVNSDEDVANTTAYEYRQFEHAPIIVVDGGSETAVDADGDGIYDTLSVTLPLEADATALGSYEWSAVLMDSEGLALGTAAGNVSFSTADVATPITMTFAASDIATTDMDGPYYVKNIILWSNVTGVSYTLNGGYETKAYRVTKFGGISRIPSRYEFVRDETTVQEGEKAIVEILGGKEDQASSVQVQVLYETAAANDLDLKNATLNGDKPKSFKFPVTLTWEKGEIGTKTIEIPVLADKAVEADETLVFQLRNPINMGLGEGHTMIVTLHDHGYDELKAKVEGGTATKTEQTQWSKLQRNGYYVRALADTADGGKVTGSGFCADGKKVTLKATANKNFTFIGWRDASGDVVAATPTLVIDRSAKPAANTKTSTTLTGISGDATYYAMFKSDPSVMVEVYATDGTGAELTGKGAGKYVAGTITGEGKYAPGKKVTLKATANKGYVFSSWQWCDDETETYYNRYSQEPSLSFTMMDSDVPVYAEFVITEQDAEYGIGLLLGDEWAEGGLFADSALRCGIAVNWPIAVDALSATTIKVAELPAGLKLVQDKATKEYRVEGVPTAVSKTNTKTGEVIPSVVKFTVTTAGKTTRTFSKSIVVKPLPQWAYGTFNGSIGHRLGADDDYRFDGHGTITMTVSAAGKISGKVALGGTNYTFSANGYSEWSSVEEDDSDAYLMVDVAAKSGKATIPVVLYGYRENQWLSEETENVANCVLWGDGEECGGYDVELRRDLWKDAGNAAALLAWAGAYTYVTDDGDVLSLVVDEKGTVKVTGLLGVKRKVSVSAPLHPYFIDVYVPPTKTDAAFFERVYLANWHGEAMAGEDTAYRDAGVVLATESLDGTGGGTIAANPKYGQVAAGKSVTLTAKAAKDSVFVKWMYENEDGEWTYDYSSTLKLVGTGYDIYVRAVFTAKENVTPPEPYVEDWESWNRAAEGRDFTGVVLVDDMARPVSFSAKNLPVGLKIDKTTGVISGTPKKAFDDIITVTATSTLNSKMTGSVEIPMKVLPEWVSGVYNGCLKDYSETTGNPLWGLERGVFTAAIVEDGSITIEMRTGYGLTSFLSTSWDYTDWNDGYAETTMTGTNGEQLSLNVWMSQEGDVDMGGSVTGGIFGQTKLRITGSHYAFEKVNGKYVNKNMSWYTKQLVRTWNLYVKEYPNAGVPDSSGNVYPYTHYLESWAFGSELPSVNLVINEDGTAIVNGEFLGEKISGTVPIVAWCDEKSDSYSVTFWQKLTNGKECCIWFDLRTDRQTGVPDVFGCAWLREGNESSISDAELLQLQFKTELTGIAVVDSNEVFYDKAALSKVSFLPPQTPVVVPKGKTVLFELSYDFPDGYGANLWTHGLWPVDDNGSKYSNPSSVYYDRGTAYGFIGIDGCRKTCTIESVSINTGARLLDDDDTYWRIGITPVNITFEK